MSNSPFSKLEISELKAWGNKKGKGVVSNLMRKRPKVIKDLLDKHGTHMIKKITIVRRPLTRAVENLIRLITLGDYDKQKKKLNYDKMFHLFMVVDYEDGQSITIEKNQRVNVYDTKLDDFTDAEYIPINLGRKRINLNDMILPSEEKYRELYRYSIENNCQRFIYTLLDSVKLLTPQLKKFITQDISTLIINPVSKKIAQGIIDIAALFDYVVKGGKHV